MRIGFDAKRAFKNATGLGHYSRTLVESLAGRYPEHEYLLFTPEETDKFKTARFPNLSTVVPGTFADKMLTSRWRNASVSRDIIKKGIDIYHGLSNQLPRGLSGSQVKTVVTVHDLIFEKYPAHYGVVDARLHREKMKYACAVADAVIAISSQTKTDLMELYAIPERKISVCWQSCDPRYWEIPGESELDTVRKKYNLPARFFLYVGSVTERKNLLTIVQALHLNNEPDIPLVVIGSGKEYKRKVQRYLSKYMMESTVIFLNDTAAGDTIGYKNSTDFPAIYRLALGLIYPSLYEGFGIPILEAMASGLPVITSNTSCMPETAGDAALFVAPTDVADLAKKMRDLAQDKLLAFSLQQAGYLQAKKFNRETAADCIMNIYRSLL